MDWRMDARMDALPSTGWGTSPAQPPVCPDTPWFRIQTALTQTGAAWPSPPSCGAIAPAGRRQGWGISSHRGTRSSGTGGTASGRENGLGHDPNADWRGLRSDCRRIRFRTFYKSDLRHCFYQMSKEDLALFRLSHINDTSDRQL